MKARAIAQAALGQSFARPGGMLWIQALVWWSVAAVATPTALLGGVLLAPGLVGLATERTPGRPVARGMLLGGLAASVAPIRALWDDGHTIAGSLALALDPSTVGLAWSAAGAGWVLAHLAPVVIRVALDAGSLSRAARLRAARARLEEEWGFGPDG
jgi:hypothetical protein